MLVSSLEAIEAFIFFSGAPFSPEPEQPNKDKRKKHPATDRWINILFFIDVSLRTPSCDLNGANIGDSDLNKPIFTQCQLSPG